MDILLIESDSAVLDTLTLILDEAGYVTHHADSGDAGVAYLQASCEPHIVIMSNQAPDNHVLITFFERVAAEPALATQHRYIALTTAPATLTPSAQAMLQSLRATVIEKPFNLDDLLAIIAG